MACVITVSWLMKLTVLGNSLSYGVIGRLPRMVLKGGLTLKGYHLAEGVCVFVYSVKGSQGE